jgi:hypothetical protein
MTDEPSGENGCVKKRFRRLKRLLLVLFVFLLALAATWTIWLLAARAQYQAALEDIRQRGEPVTVAELFATTLPDDQNAAVSLLDAVEAYKNDVVPLIEFLEEQLYNDGWAVDENAVVFNDLRQQPALRNVYSEQLQTILKADDAMLEKLVETQRRNAYAWNIKNRKEMFQGYMYSRCRQMAKYLRVCSQISHDDGDDALALEFIKQIQELRHATSSRKILIALFFCISLDALTTEIIEDIAPSLHIRNTPGSTSRMQVQSLIQQLLDDNFYQEMFHQGFLGERVLV